MKLQRIGCREGQRKGRGVGGGGKNFLIAPADSLPAGSRGGIGRIFGVTGSPPRLRVLNERMAAAGTAMPVVQRSGRSSGLEAASALLSV